MFGIMSLQRTTRYARTINFKRGHRSIVHCLFQYSIPIEDIK